MLYINNQGNLIDIDETTETESQLDFSKVEIDKYLGKNIYIDDPDFKAEDLSDRFMTFTELLDSDNPEIVKYRESKFGQNASYEEYRDLEVNLEQVLEGLKGLGEPIEEYSKIIDQVEVKSESETPLPDLNIKPIHVEYGTKTTEALADLPNLESLEPTINTQKSTPSTRIQRANSAAIDTVKLIQEEKEKINKFNQIDKENGVAPNQAQNKLKNILQNLSSGVTKLVSAVKNFNFSSKLTKIFKNINKAISNIFRKSSKDKQVELKLPEKPHEQLEISDFEMSSNLLSRETTGQLKYLRYLQAKNKAKGIGVGIEEQKQLTKSKLNRNLQTSKTNTRKSSWSR